MCLGKMVSYEQSNQPALFTQSYLKWIQYVEGLPENKWARNNEAIFFLWNFTLKKKESHNKDTVLKLIH